MTQQTSQETEQTPQEKDTPDYKKKFSESTKEAQRLLEENKSLKDRTAKVEELEKLGYNLDDVNYYIKQSGNTTNLDEGKLKREIGDIKKSLLLQKERSDLDAVIRNVPEAEPFKESLRALGRTFPKKTHKELYEEYIKPAMARGRDEASKKISEKKASQVETGKGSGEASQELTTDEFKELSLKDKKQYLVDKGVLT